MKMAGVPIASKQVKDNFWHNLKQAYLNNFNWLQFFDQPIRMIKMNRA